MTVNDPAKLLVLLVTIVGAVVLLALGRVSEAAGVGIITYALGYLSGNGRLAARGGRPEPTIGTPAPDVDVDRQVVEDQPDVVEGGWWTDGTDGPDTR